MKPWSGILPSSSIAGLHYSSCRCHLFGRRKWITFLYTTKVSANAGVNLKIKFKQTKYSKTNNELVRRGYGFWISSTALLSWISETREKKKNGENCSFGPKILKRILRERRPEKKKIPISWKCGFDHLAVNVSRSKNWIRSSNKLDSVLRQFRSSSLSNCFNRAINVPPFNVDRFETRDRKLVCNALNKS